MAGAYQRAAKNVRAINPKTGRVAGAKRKGSKPKSKPKPKGRK